MRTLRERSAAGLLARRALPFVIVVPVVLGLLTIHGREAEWFDRGLGYSFLVLSLILAVRSPHHSDVDLDAFEPVEAVHPGAFDLHLAWSRHAEVVKKAMAAGRSSTMTLTWSILLIVMSLV